MTTSSFNRLYFSEESVAAKNGDSIVLVPGKGSTLSLQDAVAISSAENRKAREMFALLFEKHSSNEASVIPLNKLQPKCLIVSEALTWKGGGWKEDISLANSFLSCLQRSVEKEYKNVLISTESLISCRFPSNRHVRIVVRQTYLFLTTHEDVSVTFVGEQTVHSTYRREISRQQLLLEDVTAIQRIRMSPAGAEYVYGDITTMPIDAIVNAANSSLRGGGGVDGAIHRAAGPLLLRACMQLHGCPTGGAVVTEGYNLPVSYVIHTVGPIWSGGMQEEDNLLASCYMSSLEKAAELNCRAVAFPAISCGAFGFPPARAVNIALHSAKTFKELTWCDMKICFCCYDSQMASLYQNELERIRDLTSA